MKTYLLMVAALSVAGIADASGSVAQAAQGHGVRGPQAALDAAYKRLPRRLNPHQREQLGRSQQAWLHFRDAQCDLEGSVLIGGPLGIEKQAQDQGRAECLARETRLRTEALRADYKLSWDGTN
jgi:uncharacterized protein YecT (DUF1311 family)